MIALSYGGGLNSFALALAAHARGLRPDLILFADTGSERPETYAHIDTVLTPWLASVGWPALTVVRWVRQSGTFAPLDAYYLGRRELPSAAYGYAGCSDKFKRQPIDKAVAAHPDVIAAIARGETVERWVGYDSGEAHRLGRSVDGGGYRWRAPLVEWDMDRDDCRAIVTAAGLAQPGKSACFCCPHSRPSEVYDLARRHPELFARSVEIERAAAAKRREEGIVSEVLGLGRRFAWEPLGAQTALFALDDELVAGLPCDCVTLRPTRERPPARTRPYARRAAQLDGHRHLLGVLPDAQIARCAGVSTATVSKMRGRESGRPWRSLL